MKKGNKQMVAREECKTKKYNIKKVQQKLSVIEKGSNMKKV